MVCACTYFGQLIGLLLCLTTAHAQQPPGCEEKLAQAQKTVLIVRDERDRAQSILAEALIALDKERAMVQGMKEKEDKGVPPVGDIKRTGPGGK